MERETILAGLVAFTLLAGLAVGFYQLWSVKDSKDKGSTSAFSWRNGSKGSKPDA